MDTKYLSDRELLALLIGPSTTAKRFNGRLAPLMIGDCLSPPTPRLAAAVELTRRLLLEGLKHGPCLTDPCMAASYLRTHFVGQEYETFVVVFLDTRHRVIAVEEMFRGSIDGAEVHAREVVRAALRRNAAACILAHNHPSGVAEPSAADRAITFRLRDALGIMDVRVLDHFVIGAEGTTSLAARGWM